MVTSVQKLSCLARPFQPPASQNKLARSMPALPLHQYDEPFKQATRCKQKERKEVHVIVKTGEAAAEGLEVIGGDCDRRVLKKKKKNKKCTRSVEDMMRDTGEKK